MPLSPPQLYSRLATEARRLARLFDSGAAALEKVAEGVTNARAHEPARARGTPHNSAAPSLPSAQPPCTPPSETSSSFGASAGAITHRLRSWVDGRPREHRSGACSTPPTAFDVWLTDAVTSAVREQGIVRDREAQVRSSTAATGSDSATLASSASVSDAEKSVVNAVATLMRLPTRFRWPASTFAFPSSSTANPTAAAARPTLPSLPASSSSSSFSSTQTATPSQVSLMLWPTGMRTTSGNLAARPPEGSTTTSIVPSTPLTALPTMVSAAQLFALATVKPTRGGAALSSAASAGTATTATALRTSVTRSGARGTCADRGSGACGGGGALYASMLEAYAVLLHTARTQAVTRGAGRTNAFAGSGAAQQHHQRLVLYCSDQCDALLVRTAQLLGIPHVRVLQTVATRHELPLADTHETRARETCPVYNYALDVRQVQARLVEDVGAGLYPLMVVGTFGSALSGSVDPIEALATFCHRLGVWFHLDASHGGTALLAQAGCGGRAALTPQCAALQVQFHAAASLADSVLVPTGHSPALPYAPLATHTKGHDDAKVGAAALFLSDIRKLAWSAQALSEARHLSMNQVLTPRVCDSDVLRVTPLAHTARWLERLHAASILMPVDGLAERVRLHQALTQSVLQAVRGDGRFDAALDAATFGLVHLRWLTAADEATGRLAEVWQRIIDGAEAGVMDGPLMDHTSSPPVQARVRLVQLQRRVWMAVSLGPVSREGRSDSDTDVVAYVMRTLHAAASVVEPSMTTTTAVRSVPPASHH